MTKVHILTPCSRAENLKFLKQNIEEIKNDSVVWHVCFDSRQAKKELKEPFIFKASCSNWIKTYESCTYFHKNPGKSQVNYVLTHFQIGMFEGFIYVLDDDNLLPPDFFDYEYDENESLIYLFNQMIDKDVIRVNDYPVRTRIDQGQIMWHSKINQYYNLHYQADGEFIENFENYKRLDKPITYYNKLAW